MTTPSDVLTFYKSDDKPLIAINLTDTNIALSRLHEIRNVNTATFGDLISVFINANSELANGIASVRQKLVNTDHRLGLLRARLLIEEVPGMIEERKLKNTQDVCQSLIMLNPDFASVSYSYEILKSALEILESKVKTLRDAQFAIRDVAQLSFSKAFKSSTLDATDTRKYSGEF